MDAKNNLFVVCPNPSCCARIQLTIELLEVTVACSRCSQLFHVRPVAVALSSLSDVARTPRGPVIEKDALALSDRGSVQTTSSTSSSKRCICGSSSHQRTSHHECPLNIHTRTGQKLKVKGKKRSGSSSQSSSPLEYQDSPPTTDSASMTSSLGTSQSSSSSLQANPQTSQGLMSNIRMGMVQSETQRDHQYSQGVGMQPSSRGSSMPNYYNPQYSYGMIHPSMMNLQQIPYPMPPGAYSGMHYQFPQQGNTNFGQYQAQYRQNMTSASSGPGVRPLHFQQPTSTTSSSSSSASQSMPPSSSV